MRNRIRKLAEAIHFRIFITLIGFQLKRDIAKVERMMEDDE